MKVLNDLLFDETLKIYQDTDYGSFTMDSLLLANFVRLKKKTLNVVDLCAGNSPISLIIANELKNIDNSRVISVEIQERLTKLSKESVELNGLKNIEIIESDLKGISSKIGKNKYQIVTVNPPYFKYDENANLKRNKYEAMARHEIFITLEEIIVESRKLLDNIGSLYLVFRPQRLDELIILLKENNFTVKRIQFVYPKINKESNTILVEAKKGKVDNQMIVEKPLIVYDENSEYTSDLKKILKMGE